MKVRGKPRNLLYLQGIRQMTTVKVPTSVKDIKPPLDMRRPFMDDIGVAIAGLRHRGG
jgi:hypothetical protein